LYRSIRAQWVHEFDRGLMAQAEALSSLVVLEHGTKLDFEFSPASMPQYEYPSDPEYFVIRFADGRVLAKSKTLDGVDSPEVPADVKAQDLVLRTGHAGRAVRLDFLPQPEGAAVSSGEPYGWLNVVVARDRGPLDRSLRHLTQNLMIGFGLVTVAVVGAMMVIVRRSLRPLRAIGERVAQIDASQLHLRLPAQDFPAELAPIHSRLNDLLERLDEAFARERRFTSDVAHELRTPIAELRSVAEVALRWPGDTAATAEALRESHDIARQMQTLVGTLLSLVRSDRMPPAPLAPIALREALDRALSDLQSERDVLRVVLDVPDDAAILAEPTLLASVLRNILSNALEYRDPSSPVRCAARSSEGRWVVVVENQTDRLVPEDIAHVFEPFWRKDPARSDAAHVGLGLALVRTYCSLMRAEVAAKFAGSRTFCVELSFQSTQFAPASEPARSQVDTALA